MALDQSKFTSLILLSAAEDLNQFGAQQGVDVAIDYSEEDSN